MVTKRKSGKMALEKSWENYSDAFLAASIVASASAAGGIPKDAIAAQKVEVKSLGNEKNMVGVTLIAS